MPTTATPAPLRPPGFSLGELTVVLLVVAVLAAFAVPVFERVRGNALERSAQVTLDAAARVGEAIAASNPGLSDEAIAAAVEGEIAEVSGLVVSVDLAAPDTVVVSQEGGSLLVSGSVRFVDGAALVDDVVSTPSSSAPSSPSSSAPSTTAAPSTTSTVAVTTTTVDPASFVLGQTGPGGGLVFYVADEPFPCGPTLSDSCTRLEAAPYQVTGWVDVGYVWSANDDVPVGPAAQSSAIGAGYANTLAVLAHDGAPSLAGSVTRAYRGPGDLGDWYLPSLGELNELCKFVRATGQTPGDPAPCAGGSSPAVFGFSAENYWSSTEIAALTAWQMSLATGERSPYAKAFTRLVRPVRAF